MSDDVLTTVQISDWHIKHQIIGGEHRLILWHKERGYIAFAVKESEFHPIPYPLAKLWFNTPGPARFGDGT